VVVELAPLFPVPPVVLDVVVDCCGSVLGVDSEVVVVPLERFGLVVVVVLGLLCADPV
jgi:hypothetical protein